MSVGLNWVWSIAHSRTRIVTYLHVCGTRMANFAVLLDKVEHGKYAGELVPELVREVRFIVERHLP